MVFVSLLVFLVKDVESRSQFSLENFLPFFLFQKGNQPEYNLTRNKFCFKLTKNNTDIDARMDASIKFYIMFGCISIFLNYLSNVCWSTSADRQIKRMRLVQIFFTYFHFIFDFRILKMNEF
jgi:hypothetical protein